jgi:hypothetical protein
MEQFRLAREYRVADWLRDAYLELTQKLPLDLEELRPSEPYSDRDAKKWEATSMDWETIARILHLQTKMAAFGYESMGMCGRQCYECDGSYVIGRICKCRVLPMVNEAFGGELEGLREDPGPDDSEHPLIPLSRKLSMPLSYLCPLKTILYSQQHQ